MFNRLSNLSNRTVLFILIGVALLSSGASLLVNLTSAHANFAEWGESWLQNFSTEMLGALLTYMLFDRIIGGREKRFEEEKAVQQEKERLIRDLGSKSNDIAVRAAEELAARGWLYDGSLVDKDFSGAKLQQATLTRANLQHAMLMNVNLQQANLDWAYLNRAMLVLANLRGARLSHACLIHANLDSSNMQLADLWSANLQEAFLKNTNLQEAKLWSANLHQANLLGANLQQAGLTSAQFDEETILPDGTKWTSTIGVDGLRRFTDPNHPQFWRSDDPGSPAYGGKAGD